MSIKRYKQLRAVIAIFISLIVSVATTRNSYLLAVAGVFTGMVFMLLVRSKTKIKVDEREKAIREKAAQMTYAIFAPTIGIGSFLLITFARGEYFFLESLGMVLAYLTLYLIALYSLAFYFFNRQLGGDKSEE